MSGILLPNGGFALVAFPKISDDRKRGQGGVCVCGGGIKAAKAQSILVSSSFLVYPLAP